MDDARARAAEIMFRHLWIPDMKRTSLNFDIAAALLEARQQAFREAAEVARRSGDEYDRVGREEGKITLCKIGCSLWDIAAAIERKGGE